MNEEIWKFSQLHLQNYLKLFPIENSSLLNIHQGYSKSILSYFLTNQENQENSLYTFMIKFLSIEKLDFSSYIFEDILSGNEKRSRMQCVNYHNESCTYLCINTNTKQYCDIQLFSGNQNNFIDHYKEQFRVLFYLEVNECEFAEYINWPLYMGCFTDDYLENNFALVYTSQFLSLKRLTNNHLHQFCQIFNIKFPDIVYNCMIELLYCISQLHKHSIAHRNIQPCNLIYSLKHQKWKLIHFEFSTFYQSVVDNYYIKGNDDFIPEELVKIRQDEEKNLEKPKKYKQNLLANDLYGLYKSLQMLINEEAINKLIKLIPKIVNLYQLQQFISILKQQYPSEKNKEKIQNIFKNQYVQCCPQIEMVSMNNLFLMQKHLYVQIQQMLIKYTNTDNFLRIKQLIMILKQLHMPIVANSLALTWFKKSTELADQIFAASQYQSLSQILKNSAETLQTYINLKQIGQIMQFKQPFQFSLCHYTNALLFYQLEQYEEYANQLLQIQEDLNREKLILREEYEFLKNINIRIQQFQEKFQIQLINSEEIDLERKLQFNGIQEELLFIILNKIIQKNEFKFQQNNRIFPALLFNPSFEDQQLVINQIYKLYPPLVQIPSIKMLIQSNDLAEYYLNEGYYEKAILNCKETIFSTQNDIDVQNAYLIKSKIYNRLGLPNKALQNLELCISQYNPVQIKEQQYQILLESFYLLNNHKAINEWIKKMNIKQNPQIVFFTLQKINISEEINQNFDYIQKVKIYRYLGNFQKAIQSCQQELQIMIQRQGYLSSQVAVLIFERSKLLIHLQKRNEALQDLITSQLIFLNFWTYETIYLLVFLMKVFYQEREKLNDLQLVKKFIESLVGIMWKKQLKFKQIKIKKQFKKLYQSFIVRLRYAIRYYVQYLDEPFPLNNEFLEDLSLKHQEFKNQYQQKFNQLRSKTVHMVKIYQQLLKWICSWELTD